MTVRYTIGRMTNQDVIKYWQNGAEDAFDTATVLLKSNKFHHALYFCHLAIEKILKGLIIHHKQIPPYVHNLYKLALLAKISLTSTQKEQLMEISTYNIEALYDDYKLKFYQKANKEYTTRWFHISRELYTWLLKQF